VGLSHAARRIGALHSTTPRTESETPPGHLAEKRPIAASVTGSSLYFLSGLRSMPKCGL
jgi:hypothetical protein